MANQILAGAVFQAGQVIAGVDASNPPYVGPSAEIIVPAENANRVSIIDSGTMEVTHTLTNPYPNGSNWGMAATTNGRSLYVKGYSEGFPNYITTTVIYNLDNLSAAPVEPTGGTKVYGNIAFTDGKAFAIVSPDGSSTGRELAEIDPTTLEKISVIPNPAGIASESGFLGGPLVAHGGKVYKGDTDYHGSQVGTSNGKVFVFDAADGSLLQEISSPSTSSNYTDINRFGSNIAVNDSWVAVTGFTTKGSVPQHYLGSVHVYDANNLGGSPVELFSSPDQRFFGSDVAVSGDYVFVGSRSEDGNDGRVHVFDMSDGGSLVTSLEVADIFSDDGDLFGSFIDATATHLFVSAPNHRHPTTVEIVGAIHKFSISDLSGSYESALGETNQQFYVSGGLTNFSVADLPVTPVTAPAPVQTSAKWVVVGVPRDNGEIGSAYVYDATDLSATPTKLTAFDGVGGDRFALSVASTNDKIVVGVHQDDDNGLNSGSVYVFDANNLSATPTKLTAFDGTQQDTFGHSVVATDDNIVVGAPNDGEGSVYVFDANNLSTQPMKLTAFDGAAYDNFGSSVAATADNIVVGAYGDDDNGSASGSVYVFDANNLSATPTKLTAFDGAAVDEFGRKVAAFDDKIIVGAADDDDNGSSSGSVYVYDANDLSAQPTKLTAFDGEAYDYFSWPVDATADKIIVGAQGDDSSSGSVYVYDANDLSAQPTKLTAFDGAASDRFGRAVAAFDDKIIVGSYRDDDNGDRSGSVYVYDANDLSATPTKLTAFDGGEYDQFGESVAIG